MIIALYILAGMTIWVILCLLNFKVGWGYDASDDDIVDMLIVAFLPWTLPYFLCAFLSGLRNGK